MNEALGGAPEPDYVMPQPWHLYSSEDHQTWRTLFSRQALLLHGRACREYLEGLRGLGVAAGGVPNFDELSDALQEATGWRIVAVPGLVPDRIFFQHLACRRFPVTWWIRKPAQMDYLQEPDVFHDLYGHVPLLMNPIFADYMQAYGEGGLKALRLGALPQLARLYWYTVEFGLIHTDTGLRIYGSGILSSKSESTHCLTSDAPNRIAFDLKRILRTRYRIDTFQKTYFVIDSFRELFDATRVDFEDYYDEVRRLEDIAAGDVLDTDAVLNRGTGRGWDESPDL